MVTCWFWGCDGDGDFYVLRDVESCGSVSLIRATGSLCHDHAIRVMAGWRLDAPYYRFYLVRGTDLSSRVV